MNPACFTHSSEGDSDSNRTTPIAALCTASNIDAQRVVGQILADVETRIMLLFASAPKSVTTQSLRRAVACYF